MGIKTKIGIVTGVFVLGLCAIAYAYDRSQDETIADGVTIGGVDVGGLNASEAESASTTGSWRRSSTR